jgi:hypothetical protein
MKLLQRYKELKEEYGWDNKKIVSFCPDMKAIIEAENTEANNHY